MKAADPLLVLRALVLGLAASPASAAADALHAVTAGGALLRVQGIGDGPIAHVKIESSWTFADVAADGAGRLVAAGVSGGGATLARVDPSSGSVTPIASTPSPVAALAFDGDGRLWGLGADAVLRLHDAESGAVLKEVALNAGLAAEGLAPASDGSLFVATAGVLSSVDPETGDVQPIGLEGAAVGLRGLDLAPDGTLHAVVDGLYAPALHFEIDAATGAATLIGPIEGTMGTSVTGIAFDPPGTVGFPAAGLGSHHDLVLSWIPGSGSGVLIGSGAPSLAPGMVVAGLDPAVVSAGGFSFLVDPNTAALVPVAFTADGSLAITVPPAVLDAIDVVQVQLLAGDAGTVHASNRAELHGGLSAGQP